MMLTYLKELHFTYIHFSGFLEFSLCFALLCLFKWEMKVKFNQEDPTTAARQFRSDNQLVILAGGSWCGKHSKVTLACELFSLQSI